MIRTLVFKTTRANHPADHVYSALAGNAYLNPLPPDLGDLIKGFDKVLIPELNSGQLSILIRARFLVDAISLTKIKGRPFKISEIRERILHLLND